MGWVPHLNVYRQVSLISTPSSKEACRSVRWSSSWATWVRGRTSTPITSAAKLSLVRENPESARVLPRHQRRDRHMPERIFYITFSRSKEDILEEITDVLQRGLLRLLQAQRHLQGLLRQVLPPDPGATQLGRGRRLRPVLQQRGRGPAGEPGQLPGRERQGQHGGHRFADRPGCSAPRSRSPTWWRC